MFTKCRNTVIKLTRELNIEKVGDKTLLHYHGQDTMTLLRLLVRIKELFLMKIRAVKILKSIEDREKQLAHMKKLVEQLSAQDEHLLDNARTQQSQMLI